MDENIVELYEREDKLLRMKQTTTIARLFSPYHLNYIPQQLYSKITQVSLVRTGIFCISFKIVVNIS